MEWALAEAARDLAWWDQDWWWWDPMRTDTEKLWDQDWWWWDPDPMRTDTEKLLFERRWWALDETGAEGIEHCRKLFEEAMKHGSVNSKDHKLLITGAAGVGKSHALAMILEEPPPSIRQSTPCATKPVRAVSMTKVGMEGESWKRAKDSVFPYMVADAARSQKPQQIQHANTLTAPVATPTPKPAATKSARPLEPPTKGTLTSPTIPKSFNIDTEIAKLIDSPFRSRLHLTEGDWINAMDSGGQLEFLELLPIFMRNTAVALFVLKLSECLSACPAIEYYNQGEPMGKPYRSPLTNEQILQRCVQAVQFQKSQSGDGHCPAMVFIGTHKDLEHTCPERLREKNQRLKALLPPTLHDNVIYYDQKMEQPIFPVNAKSPGPEERRIAAELRELIRKKSVTTSRKIPLQWHGLELLLQKMAKELGQGVIKKAECREAAKQELQFKDDNSFEEALKFLDQQGIIFYYPTLLPNIIFCNPNVILDKITELTQHIYSLRHGTGSQKYKATEGKWQRFRDQGIITTEFLSDFKSHYVPELFTPADLLKLFEGLLIVAAVNEVEYLMPCLMPVHTKDPNPPEEVAASSSSSCLSLLVHFPDSGPCLGIFCALIAHLLSVAKWKLLLRGSTPVHVSRNSVTFSVPSGYPGDITIADLFSSYFHVKINVPERFVRRLCLTIRETIFYAISKVTSQLGYHNIVPQEAFLCPKAGSECDSTPHLATIAGDWECLKCTDNPKVWSDLKEEQLVWRAPLTEQLRSDTDVRSPSPPPRKRLCQEPLVWRAPLTEQLRPSSSGDVSSQPVSRELKTSVPRSSGTPLNDTHVGMLYIILKKTSRHWYDIGLSLNFLPGELDNIQINPLLVTTAPMSCLRQVLVDYTKKSAANLEDLCQAVHSVGEEQLAHDLPVMFREAMTARTGGRTSTAPTN